MIESVSGLNDSFPENNMAVTIVGDARKFIVERFPSFLALKFLLKLVSIAVTSRIVNDLPTRNGNCKPFSSSA
jgi:hypothetical protein